MENDKQVPAILGGPGTSLREKINTWNVGQISGNSSPAQDVDAMETDQTSKVDQAAGNTSGATEGADGALGVAAGGDTGGEKPGEDAGGDADGDDEEALRKKALQTIPSQKRSRVKTTESEINARKQADEEMAKTMADYQEKKNRRILLYLPDFQVKFNDIMTDFACFIIERKCEEGAFEGNYAAVQMERDPRWDQDNKVGQLYPGSKADTKWIVNALNKMLEEKLKEKDFEYFVYLYDDFFNDWEVAILLLNGSALVSLEYDRAKVSSYLRRNLGELTAMD